MKYLIILLLLLTSCHGKFEDLEDKGNVTGKISDTRYLEDEISVVQFSADWCGYCKKQYPNMVEVSKLHKDIQFYIFDVEQNKNIQYQYRIDGLPTTIIFENGEPVLKIEGYCNSDKLDYCIKYIKENK